jgi:hypothetical protein
LVRSLCSTGSFGAEGPNARTRPIAPPRSAAFVFVFITVLVERIHDNPKTVIAQATALLRSIFE